MKLKVQNFVYFNLKKNIFNSIKLSRKKKKQIKIVREPEILYNKIYMYISLIKKKTEIKNNSNSNINITKINIKALVFIPLIQYKSI